MVGQRDDLSGRPSRRPRPHLPLWLPPLSVLDVVQQGTPEMRAKLANAIAAAAQKTALGVVAGAAVNIEILVVARDGQILGTTGTIAP